MVQNVQADVQLPRLIGLSAIGNTAGALSLIKSGTIFLAGGNNVTLSQSGQSVTISVGAVAGANFAAGLSNVGNTIGNTGTQNTGTIVLQGGNNVTLSGITGVGIPTTIIVSGVNTIPQSVQTQNMFAARISGNTVGAATALVSSGTLTIVGGNNITLSQDGGNIVTIIGGAGGVAGVNTLGMSDLGNTSGTTGVITGSALQFFLAGGNNVTLSQSINGVSATITISAANETQTVPPIGIAVKAVAAVGSTGTITRFAPEDHQHAGVFSAGVSTDGNTAGDTGVIPGRLVLLGGNNITLSVSTAAGSLQSITISAANETQTVPPIATAVKVAVSTLASTGTITRFSPEDHLHQGVNSAGVSTGGNTAGSTGAGPGRLVLFGGNLITLSQGTDATGSTVSIIGANETQTVPPIGTQVFAVATAGSTGTITRFAPEDHRHAGVNLMGVSTGGNTVGDTIVRAGQFVLQGGNQVTLSQITAAAGLNTIVFSIAETQTVPPIGETVNPVATANSIGTVTLFAGQDHRHAGVNLMGVSTSGGTAGDTTVRAGQFVLEGGANVTLSQITAALGLNTIVISANATAGVGSNSIGMSNLGNTSGTTGIASGSAVLFAFAGGNNVTLSQSINGASGTITISANVASLQHLMVAIPNTQSVIASVLTAGTMYLMPLTFPLNMRATRVDFNATFNAGSTNTQAGLTGTISIGLYSLNVSTLSLASSASVSASSSNSANQSAQLSIGSLSFATWIITPGNWWVAYYRRWSTSGTVSATGNRDSHNIFTSPWFAATYPIGMGYYSDSFSTGMPASFNTSAVTVATNSTVTLPAVYLRS